MTIVDFSGPTYKTRKSLEVVALGKNIGVIPYLRMLWWLLVCLINFGMDDSKQTDLVADPVHSWW